MVRSMWLSRWSCSSTHWLEFALFELSLGVAVGVGEAIFPAGGVVGEGDAGAVVAAATLPLVLGEIVEMLAAAGKAQECAEDHVLMVAYHLLEGEISLQAGLDLKQR